MLTTKGENMNKSMSVWVGCLASRNAGNLYGKWIDLEEDCKDINDFYAIVEEILKNSPAVGAEEWEIFHTKNLPIAFSKAGIEGLFKIINIKKNCDDKVFEAACNMGSTINEIESYIDSFVGFYDSKVDFARETISATENIPDHLFFCIDFDLYARELFFDYTFYDETGAVFAPF